VKFTFVIYHRAWVLNSSQPPQPRLWRASYQCICTWTARQWLNLKPDAGAQTCDELLAQVYAQLEECPSPASEWQAVRNPLNDDALLAALLGFGVVSVRRYATGERHCSDTVAARLQWLALLIVQLEGTYNFYGIRRWFQRPRAALDGQAPQDRLKGDWDPDDDAIQALVTLAQSATLGLIASCVDDVLNPVRLGFCVCDHTTSFLWQTAGQRAGRYSRNWDAPDHCLAINHTVAWAERFPHQEIEDPADLEGVAAALWAVLVPDHWSVQDLHPVNLSMGLVLRTTQEATEARLALVDQLKQQAFQGLLAPTAALQRSDQALPCIRLRDGSSKADELPIPAQVIMLWCPADQCLVGAVFPKAAPDLSCYPVRKEGQLNSYPQDRPTNAHPAHLSSH